MSEEREEPLVSEERRAQREALRTQYSGVVYTVPVETAKVFVAERKVAAYAEDHYLKKIKEYGGGLYITKETPDSLVKAAKRVKIKTRRARGAEDKGEESKGEEDEQ